MELGSIYSTVLSLNTILLTLLGHHLPDPHCCPHYTVDWYDNHCLHYTVDRYDITAPIQWISTILVPLLYIRSVQ
jgi:hypothetical protein